MIRGRDKAAWVHTTHILCELRNSNRPRGSSPIKFEEVYPYRRHVMRSRESDEADGINDIAAAKRMWLAATGGR